MSRRIYLGVCALLAAATVGRADEKAGSPTTHPTLERLKKLAGRWGAADESGKPTDKVVSVIKVTAAGSAVQETLFPGEPMEMVSFYHRDGADVVMTHYCAL